MPDQRELTIRAMVARAMDVMRIPLLARDYDLIKEFMTACFDNGFGPSQLIELLQGRDIGYGVERDRYHRSLLLPFSGAPLGLKGVRYAVMVTTQGVLPGSWVFVMDDDGYLNTSRDRLAAVEADGLEGMALMAAVITSSLTSPLPAPSARRRFLRK